MTLPNTSNIRERISSPTGAFRGPPVSSTTMPRARPCVGVNAIPRTWRASSCASTSMTMRPSLPPAGSNRSPANACRSARPRHCPAPRPPPQGPRCSRFLVRAFSPFRNNWIWPRNVTYKELAKPDHDMCGFLHAKSLPTGVRANIPHGNARRTTDAHLWHENYEISSGLQRALSRCLMLNLKDRVDDNAYGSAAGARRVFVTEA